MLVIHKKYSTLLLFCFLISFVGYSQRGVVSGELQDDSGPLPGVSVIIKGTTIGVETDFDGKYSIECQVNDILQYSYVGMTSKEVKVTAALFGNQIISLNATEKPVQKIISDDYLNSLKTVVDSLFMSNTTPASELQYSTKKDNLDWNKIKQIREVPGKIQLQAFNPDILYQVQFNSTTSLQFVAKNSIPKLQNTYVQGRPSNGVNTWFGPDTNELFSFGPRADELAFDGSAYVYDINGRLINGISQQQRLPYSNTLFKPSLILSTNLNLAASNKIHSVDLKLRRKTQEDLFGAEKSHLRQFDFTYDFKNSITVFIKSNVAVNNQPNTNGFINNLIRSYYLTPNSFENSQGYRLNNNQRSFSPNQVNNPLWLLALNQNRDKSSSIIFGTTYDTKLSDKINLKTNLNYTLDKNQRKFALPNNTVGFEAGYASTKYITDKMVQGSVRLNYATELRNFAWLSLVSIMNIKNDQLDYELLEQRGFSNLQFSNPLNESRRQFNGSSTVIRMTNSLKLDLNQDFDADLTIANNSVHASLQGSKLFLPSAQLSVELGDILYSEWLNTFIISAEIAKEAQDTPLYYANLSHNSLVLSPQESTSFLANHDLFNSKALRFETATNYSLETNLALFYHRVNIGVSYYQSKTKDGIFPIFTNGNFELKNSAAIKNRGIEASIEVNIGRSWESLRYHPAFFFSINKGRVLSLGEHGNSLAIAGFKNVSKNLIVGEETGTIVGSAYLRNLQGEVVIDNDGFPIVAPEKQIIGNTSPDYTLSIDNKFSLGKLKFNFLIDFQKGGDVWNGTQNTLNYSGRSQRSANLRGLSNFIFNGVTQGGTTNITPVDFTNPNQDVSQNRWARYGFDGIDEEVIADGTYLNLKTINISYNFANYNSAKFFRQVEVSLYANNLLSYTQAHGVSPNSSLFDHSLSKGLDYFNMPLAKEIGLKITLKI